MSALEDTLALHIKAAGLPEPEREARFHPVRRWKFDFAWRAQKVAFECEGGTWVGGAHNRGKHYESDCEKYSEAAILGCQPMLSKASRELSSRCRCRWPSQCCAKRRSRSFLPKRPSG